VARLRPPAPLRAIAETLLRPYAQVVFSRDLGVGVLVLLGVASFPRLALATLAAVVIAAAVSLLLGLGATAVREGGHGCIAVLTTLALGVHAPDGGNLAILLAAGAVLAVLFSASFQAVFSSTALPAYSLPFIAATWTVHLAARVLPAPVLPASLTVAWAAIPPSLLSPSWLDLPAALLFLHGAAAGALVLAAVALHSRIALVLAIVGAGVALGMRAALRAAAPWSEVDLTAGFNALLTAMAVGGIWFVPQRSAVVLAAGAAAVACLVTWALVPAAGLIGLPLLSLPFVVATHLVLTAMRMRQHDRWPRSAVPAARPEEALASHLMRVRRFGDTAWLPFRLPFRGEWVVTQGHDGPHTHQGPWRHGLDFEAVGPDGQLHTREGRGLRDYHCYGLPVLAAGAGTVALVVDGVPDNRPGELNLQDNWGNAVVVAHGVGLYSVYAHLQPLSLRVKAGEVVAAGGELGRCGASGRAATPHLHFQVQGAAPLGSPTLPVDFGDVVTANGASPTLRGRVVPAVDDRVRPVVRDEALARALGFTPGSAWDLVEAATGRRERARVEVDLLGRRLLRTEAAALVVDPYENGFVVLELQGDPRSLLRAVLLALARVPFDQAPALAWREQLSQRLLLPRWLRPLADLVAMVAPGLGAVDLAFAARREAGRLVIDGAGPGLRTRAVVALGAGAHRVEVERRGVATVVELHPVVGGEGAVTGPLTVPEAA
jgi:urea transporter/murein DD-endopeptidase MepM/ murein hydrolase activator NlpD